MDARVELDTSVGYLLKQAATALRTAMEAALRPLSLTVSQYACLEQLGARPGMSGSELARAVFVTRQSMHALLRGLEERGLLTRPASAPHGRALPTDLTGEGRAALAAASTAVAAVEQRMVAALSPAALARVRTDLSAFVAALDAPDAPTEP
ncbi:MarR family winged helix-turn-helix transcriptional regulator [Cellulomonas triticagri]|uniref:MarR family transcriptional regulator n=1 Tax=Cellulomonas triticagri TaxID=2483352 RepID=A0A3M2JIE8_9CELL|nr:MarR family transcriptional regulator [Cellulomonas triticagri]RMI13827.1 MarR family transcriptional regulator [Cellulomonas triticagri]